MMKKYTEPKKPIGNPALQTWDNLNTALRTADEKTCKKLIDEELGGRRREAFVKRIYSRLNKVRAARERTELLK